MTIPARLHFCWVGRRLEWVHAFAVMSAAAHGGMSEIILHHTDTIAEGGVLHAIRTAPRVRLAAIDPGNYLMQTGAMLGVGAKLAELYCNLASPVMRTDVLRAAILHREGGIYLDLDTITVADLTPLTEIGTFIGSEFIVWPRRVRTSLAPSQWARSLTLDLIRKLLRRRADGWRSFRRVERLYFRTVTNAAVGSCVGAPFIATYLGAMTELRPEHRRERCAIGPHLLQNLAGQCDSLDLTILEPHVFHPLPPEISHHWFRLRSRVVLDEVLPKETMSVHWYASVRTKPAPAQISPDYVMRNRCRQFYSALVYSCIGQLLPEIQTSGCGKADAVRMPKLSADAKAAASGTVSP